MSQIQELYVAIKTEFPDAKGICVNHAINSGVGEKPFWSASVYTQPISTEAEKQKAIAYASLCTAEELIPALHVDAAKRAIEKEQ